MALSGLNRSVRQLLGQIQRCRPVVATNQTGKFGKVISITAL